MIGAQVKNSLQIYQLYLLDSFINYYQISTLMKLQIALLTVITIFSVFLYSSSAPLIYKKSQFAKFKVQFGKQYNTVSEETYRETVFLQNLQLIEKHNLDPKNTYQLGVTVFADMTQEEFRDKILMKNARTKSPFVVVSNKKAVKLDGAVDWRNSSAVTEVKNQGSCGSCWAFSVTGVLQSTYKLRKGTLPSFSEQQLVDCCGIKGFGCEGCNGAWPEDALDYIANTGIVAETDYPYKGKDGKCQVESGEKILDPTAPWEMLSEGDVAGLQSWIQTQPISVCVDAGNWGLYRSGVFSNCGKVDMNHAVLLVGVRTDNVWIVKNSWGTTWGEKGYINLAAGNTCGIAVHAVIPKF